MYLERLSLFSADFRRSKKISLSGLTNNICLATFEKLWQSMWMFRNKSMKIAYFILYLACQPYPFVLHEITYFGTKFHRNVKLHIIRLKICPNKSCFHIWLRYIKYIFLDRFPASLACGRASGLRTPTSIFPDNRWILLFVLLSDL